MNLRINNLNKWNKRCVAFLSDALATILSGFGATWLSSSFTLDNMNVTLIFNIFFIQCVTYILCGLYRGVWRFASIPDLIRIIRATFIGISLIIVYLNVKGISVPIKAYIIYVILLITILSGSRILFRWLRDYPRFFTQGKRVLVVGAGSAGEGLMRDLYRSSFIYQYLPVGLVDDDPTRHGCEVHGVRVLGACRDIPRIVNQHNIELILIAIPSVSSKRMREIVNYCEESKAPFRTLPSLKNIADGVVKISSLREILLDDLLGREQVNHDWGTIQSTIMNKTILVTGGGGSIGSELCRQICRFAPACLVIVDNSEFNIYTINLELHDKIPNTRICSHLCNITDQLEIEHIFNLYKPDIVFHVAAYKHVPLLETHIRVAMLNNIIGTKIVAELSDKFQVKTFVLISTDKAVNPSSIMGATKRASEIFCQTFNLHSSTKFITVRFGNVLDSAGSVIPLFRQQLLNGGPITVTHPNISRYFMTIQEAAQLILQATTMNDQGEIFVLDMGEAIKIQYLAEQMIKLSGKKAGHDIKIEYTGLRTGEKLYEELFHKNEKIYETFHPKIKQAKVRSYDWSKLISIVNRIEIACHEHDEKQLLSLLKSLVPEYMENGVIDTLAREHDDLSPFAQSECLNQGIAN